MGNQLLICYLFKTILTLKDWIEFGGIDEYPQVELKKKPWSDNFNITQMQYKEKVY